VFGWRCRFLAEGLANRFNIPLENLIQLPYHELEAITALGTAADVTGSTRQFLDDAAIIPRLFRENPLAALQALQEFGCQNSDTMLGQTALALSRTYPQILSPGTPAPPGSSGWRLPPWLIPVAGGVAIGVGAAILWDEFTREQERVEPVSPEMRRRWYCDTRCQLAGPRENTWCTGYIRGTGYGSSHGEACAAAKNAANSQVPRGCYKRHCGCDAPGNTDCRRI
jgi:hypothetical protein